MSRTKPFSAGRFALRPFVACLTFSALVAASASADPNDQWWDGFEAAPTGKGLNNIVYDLVEYDGRLVAAGWFTQAGNNTSANRVAGFNGNGWQGMDNGMDDVVFDLLVHGGELYAAGAFATAGFGSANFVAKWDGSDWAAVGSGLGDWARAIGTYQGDLVVGGWFDTGDGSPANLVARWDGAAWVPLGSGLSGTGTPEPNARAIQEHGGYLYVGGTFTDAGGQAVDGLARWDGTSWSSFGTTLTDGGLLTVNLVEALSLDAQGRLLLAGSFSHVNGVFANGLAAWDGTTWTPLGVGLASPAGIERATLVDGDLIVTGVVSAPDGGVSIARFDGTSWSGGFGTGVSSCDLFSGAHVVAEYDGEIYVGGNICSAGGKSSNYIARWTPPDPTSVVWSELGAPSLRIAGEHPLVEATEIAFDLSRATAAELAVFDVQGRRLATLRQGEAPAGPNSTRWAGTDDRGVAVANGVYFVRLEAAGEMQTAKVVVAR